MSTFTVTVKTIRAIEVHPNADTLEVAIVDGYRSIIRKGSLKPGDLIAYIPEAALLPDTVLETLGMKGSSMFTGRDKNRVKAVRLRGVLSQGLCYPVTDPSWVEGQDVAEILGITKYMPTIPTNMRGYMWAIGLENAWNFDIENVKAHPDVLQEGENVVYTEKVHGTFTVIAHVPGSPLVVSSKGLFARGLAFSDVPENVFNLYVRVSKHWEMTERLAKAFDAGAFPKDTAVYILGETYGCQDLKYGCSIQRDTELGFRVFDIYVGQPNQGRYLNDAELDEALKVLSIPRVPILYRGPHSQDVMVQYTSGTETVSGKGLHIREGIVISPAKEREHFGLGRVKLKSVSEDYLLRKDKNATEFE
jgi:RNA ligase (TIGR02306 family)